MGNCVVLLKPKTRSCGGAAEDKNHKVLKIVKIDGKVLELESPITVNDLLANFPGFGVSVSETASQNLPSTYELKMGNIYYLRPTNTSSAVDTEEAAAGGVKRIKLVITKQQLQELLSKQISVEDVLAGLGVCGRTTSSCIDSPSTCWKPKLEPIEEVSE